MSRTAANQRLDAHCAARAADSAVRPGDFTPRWPPPTRGRPGSPCRRTEPALEADPEWNTHPRFGPDGFDLHGFHGKTVDSFWLHLIVEVGIIGVLAYLGWLWAATVRGPDALGWALTGFAAVVAVFSPALEGPLLSPLLFGALGLIYARGACDYRPRDACPVGP